MGEKIIVGPINKGLQNDAKPFVIDNDSFPVLVNAYQWRGRVKRKRGTSFLCRLERHFDSTTTKFFPSPGTINLVGGSANILTGFGLEFTGNIVPGSVTIVDTTTAVTYTDPAMDGTLSPGGTINYSTGVITIPGGGTDTITAVFDYYPGLPVMGLEDLQLNANQFPGTLGFDTTYSYIISNFQPYPAHDVSFYKNPIANGVTLPGYTPKTIQTKLKWNGQDYQQFWTTNYEQALWATNGVTVPFLTTNIGMQYKPVVAVTVTTGGPPAIVNLQITAHGLSIGDFLFINEVATTTGINFQTGYVIAIVDANNVTVEFPNAVIATNGTGGIAQYLTNNSDVTKDPIRWFDGDPNNGSSGWVNFSPPLSNLPFSIDDNPQAQYYLAGARMIVSFKDRILFIGPVIQTSVANSQVYLQDTIIYSQNGTPYYTASFNGSTTITSTTTFFPILTPVTQTAAPNAYWEDIVGLGGNIPAGYDQPIETVGFNEDVLIMGFTNRQVRVVATGSDVVPFNFFLINSELGSSSTFSTITFDRSIMTLGAHGFVQTAQVGAQRPDTDIPDEAFQVRLIDNGAQRVTAQRDFINEWAYFTYPSNQNNVANYKFPGKTLQLNYRDNTWATFYETYTTYGQFRAATGNTWADIGDDFPTWADWNEPWNAGASTLQQTKVIAGNQQGFVVFRDQGTGESESLSIQSFSGSSVNSINHCLNDGDFIVINGALGTIGAQVNGKIFQVSNSSSSNFLLAPFIGGGTYFGGGVITRMYIPFIQTKQFPISWAMGRKTRIGAQQYLLSTTSNAQITLLIYLSQDASNPYNDLNFPYNPILVPDPAAANNSLIYSTVLYTCPESTNLGLTPANINLQMVTAIQQEQIWHRINTSLIGDVVQLGFTLTNDQMKALDINGNFISQFAEIELHGFIIDVQPSQLLA